MAIWLCGYVAKWLSGPHTSLTIEFLPVAAPSQICSYSSPTINDQLSRVFVINTGSTGPNVVDVLEVPKIRLNKYWNMSGDLN